MADFTIITFGCQMNKHDSERIEEVLLREGWERAVDAARAEVVILNTCSVRDKAEQKLRSELGRLALRKRERPDLVLVVAGCMARQEGAKLLRAVPALDGVIGPDNILELPGMLRDIALGAPPLVRTSFDLEAPRFLTAPLVTAGKPCAYVTIMKGCNERCTFCVVPNTRGPERYRPSSDILDEIAQLVATGVREVTLLGQTVNSYQDPAGPLPPAPGADSSDPGESEFASLLRLIAEGVPELCRLRYTAPHPRHLTPSLIRAHAELPVLTQHVHLPVQSGSDRMLRRMARHHTRADFLARIERLRRAVPGVAITTDIIVGFCGETDADFEQTLSLVREVQFVGLFGFKYSPRPHTPALALGDDVSEAIKAERLERLFALSTELQTEHLGSLVGSEQSVLVEGPSKTAPALASGRTLRNEIVHVEPEPPASVDGLTGRVVAVAIVEAFKHSLRGRLVPAATASAGAGEPAARGAEVGS